MPSKREIGDALIVDDFPPGGATDSVAVRRKGHGPRLAAMSSGVAFSLLITAYIWLAETLQLAIRNKHFLVDIGGAVVGVIAVYIGVATILGALVGVLVRAPRWQCPAIAGAWYVALSLKMFWLDAPLLTVPSLAVAFILGSLLGASVFAAVSRRYAMPVTAPVFVVVAYFLVCQSIAANWINLGGNLVRFLTARETLIDVAVGFLCLTAALVAMSVLQERKPAWLRWMHAVVFATFALLVVGRSSLEVGSTSPHAVVASAMANPDIYVLSFDAMRRDALEQFAASHPTSAFAKLIAQAATFKNIVTEGASTYSILSNNTFESGRRDSCQDSVPGRLEQHGYTSSMVLGRYAKRIKGSHCYDYYYSGRGSTLAPRYALPAIATALNTTDARAALRAAFIPANDMVRELGRVLDGSKERPVFAYLHFLSLHAPYVPDDLKDNDEYLSDIRRYMQDCYLVACDPSNPESARLIRIAREGYDKKLAEQDSVLQRVFNLATSRARPFVVVITADHGELFGEHGGFAHSGGFVRELLNVPFVVYDSRVARPSVRCELMRASEALRITTAQLSFDPAAAYPDHEQLPVQAPPLGTAVVDREKQTIRYEIGAESQRHAGTWRNIHHSATGSDPYTVESCASQ